jgi:predicted lipoprotein
LRGSSSCAPARSQENRLERLLFWPDRRGIALRQVQGVIARATRA